MLDGHDPGTLEVRLEPDRERLVIATSGELDLATADRMAAAVVEQFEVGFGHVVADLRELTFIDSTGIRTLWQAHQRAQRDGRRLSIILGDGQVRQALDITGLVDRRDVLER
jgi:anti-sigma B factor antagonist